MKSAVNPENDRSAFCRPFVGFSSAHCRAVNHALAMAMSASSSLVETIQSCRLCADRFAQTATAHKPRPVVWFEDRARLLIVGQAPGLRVHHAGRPFADPSGDRLRRWLGVDESTFYDRSRIAIVPMAFCFPGYDSKGHDLPPPPICSETWRDRVMDRLAPRLTLVIGQYAQRWHLGADARGGVTATVARWRDLPGDVLPLPHPSWRNSGWLKKNPWFEAELVPHLQTRVAEVLT